jgi:type IV secretion system protein VirB4
VFERPVSSYFQIYAPWDDGIVVLDDGSLYAMFALTGVPTDTADIEDINHLHYRLNLTIRNIASDRLVLTVYDCRGMADPEALPKAEFRSPLAQHIHSSYMENLIEGGLLYANALFLGVQILPPQAVGQWASTKMAKWRKKSGRSPERSDARRDLLNEICGLLTTELSAYGPRRLRDVVRGNVLYSEIAEALAFAFTNIWRRVPVPAGRLGDVVLTEDIVVQGDSVEIRGPGRSTWAAVFGFREYPSKTWPGMLDAIAASQWCRTLFQRFHCLNKADAMKQMIRKQNRMLAANDKAYSQVRGLDEAADHVQSNEMIMGRHSLALVVFAQEYEMLGPVAEAAWGALADCGATIAREHKALEGAYFSMAPGNMHLQPRSGVISSRNFTSLASLHGFPRGTRRGHWGDPIAIFRNIAGEPFHFHWHEHGVGNTLITGVTGSGKTLLTGFLLAASARYAGVIALDHKRGWETLIRGMGGSYAILGNRQPYFAPLKGLANTPQNLDHLYSLIRGCIQMGGWRELTSEEDRRLSLALKIVMDLEPKDRSLSEVRAFLGSDPDGAGARLERWCWGNDRGWVIDGPEDILSLKGDLFGFDTTRLLENQFARGPAMLDLLHRISLRLDGRPLVVAIDEGWRALMDETFRPAIEKSLRTIRSFNGILVFITQDPRDVVDSGIAAALVGQCPNQIHLPNPRARENDYIHHLKCKPGEYEQIRTLARGSFVLRRDLGGAVLSLTLGGLDDVIAVLSTPQEQLNLLDEAIQSVGENPAELLAEYHRRRKELVTT